MGLVPCGNLTLILLGDIGILIAGKFLVGIEECMIVARVVTESEVVVTNGIHYLSTKSWVGDMFLGQLHQFCAVRAHVALEFHTVACH